MAYMARAPDKGLLGGLRSSVSIPTAAATSAMSPTGSMSSLSSLEKLMEPAGMSSSCSSPNAAAAAAAATATFSSSPGGWQTTLDMQMCGGGGGGGGGGGQAAGSFGDLLGSMQCGSSANNAWEQYLDAKPRYSTTSCNLPPVSMSMSMSTSGGSSSRGMMMMMEGARIRESLGFNHGNGNGGIVRSKWSPMETSGITVDPSKGGLALQGVGLATSHCLAQFTSDPGFAERAAKFSSFGNGAYHNYNNNSSSSSSLHNHLHSSQIAQPLPVHEGGSKGRGGSRSSEASSGKLSRTSSCQNSGAVKKMGMAVAAELLEAKVKEAREVVGDDKSLPGTVELEAVEGAAAAAATLAHEVEDVAAAAAQQQQQENHSSCAEEHHHGAGSPTGSLDSAPRKRKSPAADKQDRHACKVSDAGDSKPKRCKGEDGRTIDRDDVKHSKAERSCSENSGDESGSPRAHHRESNKSKEMLSKQDFIHVRARRGQATDSHSLAERVRREKISERMKYLQDLVPGCSKVTGKAVMLDEIINYVQSLQRQVEHLSMKLASVNPGRLDFNLESALNNKDSMLQSRFLSSILNGPEMNATYGLPQHQQQQQQQQGPMLGGPCGLDFRTMGSAMDTYLRRTTSAPITGLSGITNSMGTFGDDASQSIGWDGELQSIVQTGFGRLGSSFLDSIHCQLPVGHMKMEL